jgi:hypothetical protein
LLSVDDLGRLCGTLSFVFEKHQLVTTLGQAGEGDVPPHREALHLAEQPWLDAKVQAFTLQADGRI